jgi:hypothetical protein
MATLTEIETALRNADAAGDAEGARILAGEYTRLKQADMPQRPGALERGARGVWRGLTDLQDGYQQLQTRVGTGLGLPGAEDRKNLTDARIKFDEAQYKQDVRGGQGDVDFGRIGGNMLGTLPLNFLVPGGGTMLQAAKAAALGSGAAAALQPVMQGDFWTEKAKQVGTGMAAGAIGGAVANKIGSMISPTLSPEVAALRAQGVTPTPGQIMGGGMQRFEEKMASVPVLGDAIKGGQQRAVEQFNATAVNRALSPIGESLPAKTVGREAIQYADDALGKAYDKALSAVGPLRPDAQLSADLNQVYSALSVLPKDKADQFARILQVEIGDRAKTGVLTPEAMKAAESNLGRLGRGYMRAQDFDQQELGKAIIEAQGAMRQMVERQAPPGAADMVRAANTGWANFKRVQRAASYTGADEGVFSAANLQQAVRALDTSKDKARFAEGNALMQDLSEAGRKVLGNKVPNSGTADRAAAMSLLSPTTWPYLAAGIPASLMYTGPGQAAMAGLLTGRQGPAAGLLAGAVRRAGAPAGIALTPALQGLLAE